jgi:hypothetical protein
VTCTTCGQPICWDGSPRAGLRHQADLRADRHYGWIHATGSIGASAELDADHPATPYPEQPHLFREATAEAVIETGAGRYVLVGTLKESP